VAGLRVAITALALLAAAPAGAQSVVHWRPYIEAASARFGVPVEWIERVMRAESGGRTMLDGRPITSHAGAMGLMQLMPGTWSEMRARLGLGSDPHSPRDNILAGTLYLRLMYDRFGYPGLFAAYNAGPARYAEHVRTGRALPGETRAYLASVAGVPVNSQSAVAAASATPRTANAIFFAIGDRPPAGRSEAGAATLFVALRSTSPEKNAPDRP